MEPLAALGVAAAVVQLFDFTFRTCEKVSRILTDGSWGMIEQVSFETVLYDLERFSSSLKRRQKFAQGSDLSLRENDEAIDKIVEACQPIIQRLAEIFHELHIVRTRKIEYDHELMLDKPDRQEKDPNKSKIKKVALMPLSMMRAAWRKPEIDALLQHLSQLQSQLTLRILHHLSNVTSQTNLEQRSQFGGLSQNYSDIIEVLTVSEQKLALVEKQSQYLKLAMDQSESRAMARDEKIIAALLTLRNGDTKLVKSDESFSEEYDKSIPKSIMTLRASRSPDTAEASIGDFSRVFDRILSCLFFRQIMDREETLSQAHANTYEWIFCDPAVSDKPWSSFVQWLESGTGCYWVSGKAGSGKSTLMKYIFHDPRTRKALRKWAGQAHLVSACFFFWNLGTDLQKSQAGLLRSILYDILVQRPYLISAVMPELLRTAANTPDTQVLSEPNHVELLRWFRRLLQQASSSSRLFFLIDGLDEFDGDHQEIVDLITSSAKNNNVKFLVSSRPIPVCVDVFSQSPTLHLHDLTRGDIQKYVEDHLQESFKKRHSLEMSELVDEVVDKSSGVFLWVVLVARSLLNGLRNYDNIKELRERLDELPSNLKELYAHMLEQVPSKYRRGASELFQTVILAANVQASEFRLSPLQLYFAFQDRELLLKTPIKQITHNEMTSKIDEVDGRLRSRSMGLLEVRLLSRVKTNRFAPGPVKIHSIDFIHKTAVEFLQAKEVWDGIIQLTSNTGFDPAANLFRSCVHMCKARGADDVLQLEDSFVWAMMDRAMAYATIAKDGTQPTTNEEFEDLDKVMTHHWKSATKCLCSTNLRFPTSGHWTSGYTFSSDSPLTGKLIHATKPTTLESLLVYHGLPAAIHNSRQHVTDNQASILLHDAVKYLLIRPQASQEQSHKAKLCVGLLNQGASPNTNYSGSSQTPWQRMLLHATEALETKSQFQREFLAKGFAHAYSRLLISFITHSADVNATVSWIPRTHSATSVVQTWTALSVIDELFSSEPASFVEHDPFDETMPYTASAEISQFHGYITGLLVQRGAEKEKRVASPSSNVDAARSGSQPVESPAAKRPRRRKLARFWKFGSSLKTSLRL